MNLKFWIIQTMLSYVYKQDIYILLCNRIVFVCCNVVTNKKWCHHQFDSFKLKMKFKKSVNLLISPSKYHNIYFFLFFFLHILFISLKKTHLSILPLWLWPLWSGAKLTGSFIFVAFPFQLRGWGWAEIKYRHAPTPDSQTSGSHCRSSVAAESKHTAAHF